MSHSLHTSIVCERFARTDSIIRRQPKRRWLGRFSAPYRRSLRSTTESAELDSEMGFQQLKRMFATPRRLGLAVLGRRSENHRYSPSPRDGTRFGNRIFGVYP